jgi:hypothetical protein
MVLQGISQTLIANGDLPTSRVEKILIAIKGLSTSEVDQVWVAVRDLSISQEGRKDQETYEPHQVADLEVREQHLEEIQESWTISEEQPLEPEIEEFLACLSPDPSCISGCDDQLSKELHDLTSRESQERKYYIEAWFQAVVRPQHPSIFLASSPEEKLASHIGATIEVSFPYLDMSLLINLFRTWLHWKFSYT